MLKKMLTTTVPTALAATIAFGASFALAGDLTLTIEGVRNDKGLLMVALYNSEASYLKEGQSVAAVKLQAKPGTMRVVFPDLPDGHYAASIFHDEDQDGELQTNMMGVPTEGFGFSQDARGVFGPATFQDAAVTLAGKAASSHSILQY